MPATWAVVSGVSSPAASTQFHHVRKMVHFPGVVRTGGLWAGDAVLLRLSSPLELDRNTQPVCLPDSPPPPKANCVIAGWNRLHHGKLSLTRLTSCLLEHSIFIKMDLYER